MACHGADLRQKELDLSTWATALKGGESGPVIVPGKPDESRLYEFISKGTMPPGDVYLGERDIEMIRSWIDAGALSPDG